MAKTADSVLDRHQPAAQPPQPAVDEVPARRAGTDTAVDADRFVAARIRQRRRELSMNQRDFAKALGVSLQQVHKYETGTNRVSAGRLYVMADTLGVSVDYFYPPSSMPNFGENASADKAELARLVSALTDSSHRDALRRLCGLFLRAERGGTSNSPEGPGGD